MLFLLRCKVLLRLLLLHIPWFLTLFYVLYLSLKYCSLPSLIFPILNVPCALLGFSFSSLLLCLLLLIPFLFPPSYNIPCSNFSFLLPLQTAALHSYFILFFILSFVLNYLPFSLHYQLTPRLLFLLLTSLLPLFSVYSSVNQFPSPFSSILPSSLPPPSFLAQSPVSPPIPYSAL